MIIFKKTYCFFNKDVFYYIYDDAKEIYFLYYFHVAVNFVHWTIVLIYYYEKIDCLFIVIVNETILCV